MKTHIVAFAALVALSIPAVVSAQGYTGPYDYIMVGGSDGTAATTSFNGRGFWHTNSVPTTTQVPVGFVPGAGIYYVGGNGTQLRIPTGGSNYFNGDLLVVDANAFLVDKATGSATTTVPNFIFRGALIHGDNLHKTLNGANWEIPADADARLRATDANYREYTVNSVFTGTGKLTLDVRNITLVNLLPTSTSATGLKRINMTGNNSGLTGRVDVLGGDWSSTPGWGFDPSVSATRESRLQIVNGHNLGGEMAAFDAEGLKINNLVLSFVGNPATAITNLNRGITIGAGNAAFETAAGRTATIDSPITGGAITARGGGTFVFNGSNTVAMTVAAGTDVNGRGSFDGAVVLPAGVTMDFADGVCGTFGLHNPAGVTLNAATLSFDVGATPGSGRDRLVIGGPLNLAGETKVSVNFHEGPPAPGDYVIAEYTMKTGLGYFELDPPVAGASLFTGGSELVLKIVGASVEVVTTGTRDVNWVDAGLAGVLYAAPKTVWYCLDSGAGSGNGTSQDTNDWDFVSAPFAVANPGAMLTTMENLVPGTDYYAIYVVDDGAGGLSWSEDAVFFRTREPEPEIRILPETGLAWFECTVNAHMDWTGSKSDPADVTMVWGVGDPEAADPTVWTGGGTTTLVNRAAGPIVITLEGLAHGTEYNYRFLATNKVANIAAWTDTGRFKTHARVFYWNKNSANQQWAVAANWNLESHATSSPLAGDYPRLPGDVARLNYGVTIGLDRSVTVGVVRIAVSRTNVLATEPGAEIVFDNGNEPSMIEKTLQYVVGSYSSRITAPMVVKSKLVHRYLESDIFYALDPATELYGTITGDNPEFNVENRYIKWGLEEDFVFTGKLSGQHIAKKGAGTLTLRGDNMFFNHMYNAPPYEGGGITQGGLVYEGGTYTNLTTGDVRLFTGNDAFMAVSNGCQMVTHGKQIIGLWVSSAMRYSGNRITVTGDTTVWRANHATIGNRDFQMCSLNNIVEVLDGAVLDNIGTFTVGYTTNAIVVMPTTITGGNLLRTGTGGTVNCATLKVYPNNGLSPWLAADGTAPGTVNVTGTATFDAGSYINPVSELGTKAGMKTGKHLILKANAIVDPGDIDLVPEAKATGHWKLFKEPKNAPTEFWLSFSYPATMVIVR